jgi:catechol 2,3-dioxygenase
MANICARLAHMGIYVQDRDRMERFYTEVLGLIVTDQGEAAPACT